MKGMLKSTISKKRMVILALLTIHCSLFISPVRAQVGTWRNYLSYHEPQQIVKAGNGLFVRASNDLYQYNLTDHSITTYDKLTGLSDNYITHIAWNQQAKRLIIVYQNSNIDLMDTAGNITNISSLYRKATTEDKTIDSLTIDAQYAYLYARLGIVKVDMKRAEISDTYTKNHPDYPTSLPAYANNDWAQYIDVVKTLKPGGPKYNFFQESVFKDGKLYATEFPLRGNLPEIDSGETFSLLQKSFNQDVRRYLVQYFEKNADTIRGSLSVDKALGKVYKWCDEQELKLDAQDCFRKGIKSEDISYKIHFHFEFLGQMSMIRYVDNPSEIVKDEAEWFLEANRDLVRCIIQEHDVLKWYLKQWESLQESNSHKQQEESIYAN